MPRSARTRARALAITFVTATSLVVAGVGFGVAAHAHPAPFTVVGYDEAGSTSAKQLAATKGVATTIGIDGVNVAPTATHIDAVSPAALADLARAHAQGQKAELLVGNFDGSIGDFSPAIGDRLLGSSLHRQKIVAALKAEVAIHGWNGVTIDLESLTPTYPKQLTQFVSQLKAALGPSKTVSICLMATSDNDYAAYGYDLAGLGRAADEVVLMGYDQHGPTWTSAGPVGGQPWVAAAAKPLTKAIPTSKLVLGVAGYGYTWPQRGDGVQVSDAKARALVAKDHVKAIWSSTQLEWHATLSNGTVLWWSDAKTYAARVAYAKRLGWSGVAVWSLALSDPLAR